MTSGTKTPDSLALAKVSMNYQKDIEKSLRILIVHAAKGSGETGWHKVVEGLFDENQIKWMAEEYEKFIYVSESSEMAKGETLRHLQACQKQTIDLSTTLNYLRGSGWNELRQAYKKQSEQRGLINLVDLDRVMLDLHLAAIQAKNVIETLPIRKGPKTDKRPLEIAKIAARQYNRITRDEPGRIVEVDGKRASTRGVFSGFLAEVFAAVGVVASVDHHAKLASSWWKNERDDFDFRNAKTPVQADDV